MANDSDKLTVRRIRFDIGDWFEGDIATLGNPRYCYGIFNDGAVTAYAMLNMYMRHKIDAFFDAIECEFAEKGNEWHDAVRAYLTRLLINVARYINCTIKNVSSASSKEWSMVLAAMRMINQSYSDCSLTLEMISDTLYVSKSNLSRVFKSLTGNLFSEYLRDVGLGHAYRLLKDTSMTVEEIVKLCGLRDIPSFYKSFNTHMHMTPFEYRRSMKISDNESEEYKKIIKREKIMSILNDISTNLQQGKSKIVN